MRQLTPGLILQEKIHIEKIRELPIAGKILVSSGSLVTAEDVIAKAEIPGELRILKLPELTGLDAAQALNSLRIKEGDLIKLNQEVLNYSSFWGLFKANLLSPVAGEVEFISASTAHIGIRLKPKPIELKAYLSGRVVEVIGNTAVRIETEASLFQGIFGLGAERFGRIRLLEIAAGQKITESCIPENCKGHILIGGTTPDILALKKIAASGASGLICGGIEGGVIREFLGYELGLALTGSEQIPFTLIITEGFGSLALSQKVLDLSKKLTGQVASINGATQVRAGALRPELIVSNTPLKPSIVKSEKTLSIGANVRVIRYPYFGQVASVIELPEQVQPIATGAEARVVKIKLPNSEIVLVPRANIEMF